MNGECWDDTIVVTLTNNLNETSSTQLVPTSRMNKW